MPFHGERKGFGRLLGQSAKYSVRFAKLLRMEYLLGILPVIVVGITLASLSIAQARGHRADILRLEEKMNSIEKKMDSKIDALEVKMNSKFDGLSDEMGSLRERMAHLEGLMEGLREAITGRRAA